MTQAELVIKEGVAGVWFYHLTYADNYVSLCGQRVMNTSMQLDHWDCTPENYHIPEKWCKKCESLRKETS